MSSARRFQFKFGIRRRIFSMWLPLFLLSKKITWWIFLIFIREKKKKKFCSDRFVWLTRNNILVAVLSDSIRYGSFARFFFSSSFQRLWRSKAVEVYYVGYYTGRLMILPLSCPLFVSVDAWRNSAASLLNTSCSHCPLNNSCSRWRSSV